jgi:hypothetical protein
MEKVAVIDKLLFPVPAAVYGGPEIPDPGSLTGRAERAEGRIHVASLLADRTVVNSIDLLHSVSPGKRCTDLVSGFVKYKHAECREQVIEEAYAGITVAGRRALTVHHIPVRFLPLRDRFPHRSKRFLLM